MKRLATGLSLAIGACAASMQPNARPASKAEVIGTWTLSSVDEHAISPKALVVTFRPNGQVSGTILCNSFGGRYQLAVGRLSFLNLNQTLLGCEAPGFDQMQRAWAPFLHATNALTTATSELLVLKVGGRTYKLTRTCS